MAQLIQSVITDAYAAYSTVYAQPKPSQLLTPEQKMEYESEIYSVLIIRPVRVGEQLVTDVCARLSNATTTVGPDDVLEPFDSRSPSAFPVLYQGTLYDGLKLVTPVHHENVRPALTPEQVVFLVEILGEDQLLSALPTWAQGRPIRTWKRVFPTLTDQWHRLALWMVMHQRFCSGRMSKFYWRKIWMKINAQGKRIYPKRLINEDHKFFIPDEYLTDRKRDEILFAVRDEAHMLLLFRLQKRLERLTHTHVAQLISQPVGDRRLIFPMRNQVRLDDGTLQHPDWVIRPDGTRQAFNPDGPAGVPMPVALFHRQPAYIKWFLLTTFPDRVQHIEPPPVMYQFGRRKWEQGERRWLEFPGSDARFDRKRRYSDWKLELAQSLTEWKREEDLQRLYSRVETWSVKLKLDPKTPEQCWEGPILNSRDVRRARKMAEAYNARVNKLGAELLDVRYRHPPQVERVIAGLVGQARIDTPMQVWMYTLFLKRGITIVQPRVEKALKNDFALMGRTADDLQVVLDKLPAFVVKHVALNYSDLALENISPFDKEDAIAMLHRAVREVEYQTSSVEGRGEREILNDRRRRFIQELSASRNTERLFQPTLGEELDGEDVDEDDEGVVYVVEDA